MSSDILTFRAHVEGLDKAVNKLDKEISTLPSLLERELDRLGDEIVSEARSNLQNNTSVITGHLLSTIRKFDPNEVIVDDADVVKADSISIVVGTDAEYAEYVEYGRGPVKPIHAKALHWIDPHTGKDVFAAYAGPAEPKPFLEPAVILYTEQFDDLVVKKIEEEFD